MPAPHAFRYPGAKTKLADLIIPKFPQHFWGKPLLSSAAPGIEYREPFFGSGAVGLQILYQLPTGTKAWINDADPGIANYWKAVVYNHKEIISQVLACDPTIELYREYLDRSDDATLDVVTSGFITLFLHQCSYSGLGKKAGSPIGGWEPKGKEYQIDCRWHKDSLAKNILECHKFLACLTLKITNLDFAKVFNEMDQPEDTFFYLDPPYVKRGDKLYVESMEKADHERLSGILHRIKNPWVLSYDDDPLVRSLYGDCQIESLEARYRVTNGVQRQQTRKDVTSELLITPYPKLILPEKGYLTGVTKGYDFGQLEDISGIPAEVIRNRLRRGWGLHRATSQPARHYQRDKAGDIAPIEEN